MSNSFGKSGNLHRQRRAGPEAHGTSQTFGGDGGGGGGGSGGHSDSRVASNQKGQRTEESDQATTTRGGGSGGGRVLEGSDSAGQSKGANAAQRASLPERQAEFGLSADPTRSSSGKSSSNESVVDASPSLQHEQQQQRPSSAAARRPTSGGSGGGFATSNTQRLSSIEILNENRQRQLQLEQQESFLQHLEQRQRFIQQQQQAQQLLTADELDCAAYQVETSAPEYARMAAAAAAKAAAKAAAPTSAASRKSASASGRAPVNPFDEEPPYPAVEPREPATVSGRSGFLTALMGEGVEAAENGDANPLAHQPANKQQQQQQQQVLAASARRAESFDSADHETRYSKVVQAGACSYNYDGSNDDARPFYRKDIGTLLSDCRGSRKLVILIVAVALLLDNMLLTAVVPIIPAYLYKLRMVREHRNLLAAGNGTTAPSSSSAGRFSTLDANQDGRVDEAELEAELDRRINESLSSAQDRFSGSFFHPRVLKPRDKFGNPMRSAEESLDDDNGREDGADRDASPDPESRRKGTDSEADDDRGDSGWEDEARGARKGRKRMRYPRAETSSSSSAGGRSSKLAANLDDDDEYEASDDGDKADGVGSAPVDDSRVSLNGEPDREEASAGAPAPLAAAKQVIRSAATSTRASINANTKAGDGKLSRAIAQGKTDGGGGKVTKGEERDVQDNDDGRDDDDEEAPASRRWNMLRSSLLEMAEQSGNDTDALGGMCLSLVLDRPNYFNRRDRNQNPDEGQPGLLAPPLKPPAPPLRSRPGSKAAARQDRDENENANDGPKGEQGPDTRRRGQKQARAGAGDQAGRRGAARARVERVRPPQTSKFAAEDRRKGAESGSTTAQPDETSKRPLAADDDGELIINHQDIVDESFEVGVMFASKPIVQAIANPFVGAITNRVGFTLPMFLGFTIMFLSTLVFAFGETYSTLFLARAIQGVGSACTSVAGMSMIADRFPDDAERGNAMAVALGGLALGVVIGPPFGGFMFEFFGKPSPFIVLAILALLDGLLQLLVLQPRISKCQDEGASLLTLIKDPYILVAAGAITFANTGIGILEPALPLWMMDTMQARNWEQGVAFLPAALSYLFSTNLFGNLGLRIGRWRSAMLGLVIIGCALLLIPFASRVDHLILPNGAIGFAIGMVDSTMMPMLGYLVDIRHTSVYGSVYAIGDVAFCASFVFGPALSGTLVELIGFEGLIVTTALICFAFAPLLVLLRDPPARQLNEAQLQEQSTLRYVNYNHLDSPDEEAHLPKGAKADAKS